MRSLLFLSFSVLTLTIFSGCSTRSFVAYDYINLDERSITIPAGHGGFIADLKIFLTKEGWDVVSDRGPEVTENLNHGQRSEKSDTFKTKYRLQAQYSWSDECWGEPKFYFDIALVENKTGKEVFAYTGSDCQSGLDKTLQDAFKNHAAKPLRGHRDEFTSRGLDDSENSLASLGAHLGANTGTSLGWNRESPWPD